MKNRRKNDEFCHFVTLKNISKRVDNDKITLFWGSGPPKSTPGPPKSTPRDRSGTPKPDPRTLKPTPRGLKIKVG